jgi:hypothetical protein
MVKVAKVQPDGAPVFRVLLMWVPELAEQATEARLAAVQVHQGWVRRLELEAEKCLRTELPVGCREPRQLVQVSKVQDAQAQEGLVPMV